MIDKERPSLRVKSPCSWSHSCATQVLGLLSDSTYVLKPAHSFDTVPIMSRDASMLVMCWNICVSQRVFLPLTILWNTTFQAMMILHQERNSKLAEDEKSSLKELKLKATTDALNLIHACKHVRREWYHKMRGSTEAVSLRSHSVFVLA